MSYIPLFLDLGVIRTAAAVESTSTYTYASANPTARSKCDEFTTLALDVAFTKATITSIEIIVEGSNSEDATVWYPYSIATFSTPTDNVEKVVYSLVASKYAATDTIHIPVSINHRFMRVGVKGTGTLTGSSVQISAALIRK